MAGRSIPALDFRVIWLAALLATGIHFIPMVLVHGPPMAWLGLALTANALIGLLEPGLSFALTSTVDGLIKIGVGAGLLYFPGRAAPGAWEAEAIDV